MAVLPPELRAWIVPGTAGALATVDPTGQPQITRAWAARPLPERDVIEVYVLRSASSALLESLANGGRAALSLIEVSTYRSRLFKGSCQLAPVGTDAAFLEESLAAFNRAVSGVGMAADTAERMLAHSDAPRAMVALYLSVESVFDQSPRPGAGARLQCVP